MEQSGNLSYSLLSNTKKVSNGPMYMQFELLPTLLERVCWLVYLKRRKAFCTSLAINSTHKTERQSHKLRYDVSGTELHMKVSRAF